MEFKASDTIVRAARELLRWDQKTLALHAKVGVATVRRFETGSDIQADKEAAIVAALQAAGVAFIGPKTGGVAITEGVALTPAAEPLARPEPRVYRPRKKKRKKRKAATAPA